MYRTISTIARLCLPALLAAAVASTGWTAGVQRKAIYFTRSQGFEHGAVKRQNGELAYSEKAIQKVCDELGYDLIITKDGSILTPANIEEFDVFIFYATGNLTAPGDKDGGKPISEEGLQALLEAVKGGKGFVGIHAGNDAMRNPGGPPSPFIQMLGGEFKGHGAQQVATLKVVSPDFPGIDAIEGGSLTFNEEWYVNTNLSPDMQVILLQQTEGMKGDQYNIPAYPATWAKMYGKGRVYYNSLGHREDVWTNPTVLKVMMGGIKWAAGDAEYKVKPNIKEVCPKAFELMGAK